MTQHFWLRHITQVLVILHSTRHGIPVPEQRYSLNGESNDCYRDLT
jgi:hypothetical protein